MKLKLSAIRKRRLKFPIDLDEPEQMDLLKNDLLAKWEFDQIKTEKILRKYSGKIQKYSAMHAEIMYNLLRCHLKSLKPDKQRAYIISKKVNYTTLGDVSGLEFYFTSVLNVLLAGAVVSCLSISHKVTICVLLSMVAVIITFIKQSGKPRFFMEILTTVENNLSDDKNDE